MHRPAVSTKTMQRIDRLLRSLVGVADVRVLWRAHTPRAVHILRDAATQPHQLIRNIVSGMHAGFGIQLQPTQVHIHEDAQVFDALGIAADVLTGSDDDATESAPAATNGAHTNGASTNGTHANGNGAAKSAADATSRNGTAGNGAAKNGLHHGASKNGAHNGGPASGDGQNGATARNGSATAGVPVNGSGNGHVVRPSPPAKPRPEPVTTGVVARPSSASADVIAAAAELIARRQHDELTDGLTLERIDVERRSGTLRCRTVLALGERQYSAIAEVPDSPSAEAELAARVAVDALRAGGLTTAMLDGVGFITIGKTNYCVASVREPGSKHPRASAAPLIDSMAASATAAVLTALGSFTDARAHKRARAGH
jgi:hypothetical protein